ncbi:MAG TPA: DUF5675 family protein [Syntrophorhabdaceae bacterium]|nr:DUF5675 family protein [Syntrophorhabdaceae bacterium]
MKLVHIIRLEKSSEGILGTLLIDRKIFSVTLERDDTFIKQGMYHCQRFHGVKWPDTFEIEIAGHTAVLFHAGNVEADTAGCILLGATAGKLRGQRAVLNSGATFKAFMDHFKETDWFSLYISNVFY